MSGVAYPRNTLTELLEQTARMNSVGGHRGGAVHTGESPPSVQSAAMRHAQDPDEAPLSLEERLELDRLAIAAGVQDERLGNVGGPDAAASDPSQGQYDSMEAALAAGAPVHQPTPPVPVAPRVTPTGRVQTTRPNIGHPPAPATTVVEQPRLPDFKKVQGIDLMDGTVWVDDIKFPIPAPELAEFRKYAVQVARDFIMRELQEALTRFESEDANGGDEEA